MIEVEHLTRRYGALTAVDDISFSVEKGEIVGFLGPNGAGKSTTMRILTGSLGATDGHARIGGHDVSEAPQKVQRLVGYLPETPPLYPDMTVRQYLRYAARLKRAEDRWQSVEDSIRNVGLNTVAHRIIGHLSKGFRQRVGIAQALVHRPAVLILDEPTSGLDPTQRVEIRNLVRDLAGGETTVLLSTHILPEVEAICDRVIILHQGRIATEDSLSAMREAQGVVFVRVARPAEDLASRLSALDGVTRVTDGDEVGTFLVECADEVREAVASEAVGCGLLELTLRRAGLEEIFLRATSGAA